MAYFYFVIIKITLRTKMQLKKNYRQKINFDKSLTRQLCDVIEVASPC